MLFGSVLYESLIEATGTGALGDVILAAADAEIGVDEVFGYWVEEGSIPIRIASSGKLGSAAKRATLYSEQYYALDPLIWLGANLKDGAPSRHGRLAASDIPDALYRRECYEHPGLFEKLSFGRRRGSRHYVLSFYRRQGRSRVVDGALSDLADIVFPILRKQVELLGDSANAPLIERITNRIGYAFRSLTRREKEVCARTLIGMTAEAIALELGIGETTVLTYRRRAYERYGLSSAHEMVGAIIA